MDFHYLFWKIFHEKYLKYLLQILFSFSEIYLEPSQISEVELFAKIFNGL